jgi:hypothetical protein
MIAANQHPLAAAAIYVAAANKSAPLSGAPGTTLASLIETARVLNDQVDRHQREVVDRASGQAAIRVAVAENNALGDVWVDALDEAAHHPVSTAADLRLKLAFMLENQMGDGRDWLDTISKDVARIAEARA